jgi:hypothetical protein
MDFNIQCLWGKLVNQPLCNRLAAAVVAAHQQMAAPLTAAKTKKEDWTTLQQEGQVLKIMG